MERIELGRATTVGQALPLGVDDPVVAARAVRRALSAGGRRAIEVDALIVAAVEPIPPDRLRAFARRALGPNGDTVAIVDMVAQGPDATSLADVAAGPTARPPGDERPSTRRPAGVVIAVGLAVDGTTEARCLGR